MRILQLIPVVLLILSQSLMGDEPTTTPPSEIVPADLKTWKIEYYLHSLEMGSKRVTLTQDGMMCDYGNGRDPRILSARLAAADVAVVFAATRGFVNSVRLREFNETLCDATWHVSLEVNEACRIRISLDPWEVERDGFALEFNRCVETFHRYGARQFPRLDTTAKVKFPRQVPLLDRLPEEGARWHSGISSSVKDSADIGFFDKSVGCTHLGREFVKTELPVTPLDREMHQSTMRTILNQFRLRIAHERAGTVASQAVNFFLKGDKSVRLTMNRDTLSEMKVLDDVNRYVEDVNRRLEEGSTKLRFIPPWE